MNSRSNYNSLIFLTTLSVYLGLVLVGGNAPTVLAQAATTRNFDVKSEIVVEDDLDKKPDDGAAEDAALARSFRIADALVDFVADLRNLEAAGALDASPDWDFVFTTVLDRFETTQRSSATARLSDPRLKPLIENLLATAQPDTTRSISERIAHDEVFSVRSSAAVSLGANEFSLRFGFFKKSAAAAKASAAAINAVFIEQKVALTDSARLPIYENTAAFAENNQVFIVTRLPRASIDALLAEK